MRFVLSSLLLKMRFDPFDRKVALIIAGIGLVLALVILIGNQSGMPAPEILSDQEGVGANGPVSLSFSAPVDIESVEPALTVTSRDGQTLEGSWEWVGQQEARFYPARSFIPGEVIALRLEVGARTQQGLILRESQTWQVRVRPAEVLYLSPVETPELWRISPDRGTPVQLTQTGGRLFDYAVSKDGSQIVYSAYNDEQGIDLWEVNRAGGEPRLLLPCAADWCINPVYSPDGQQIAYTRRGARGVAGPGLPQVWTLNKQTLVTDPLFSDPAMTGFDPDWSPNGRYLSFYDSSAVGIRVLDLEAEQDFLAPSNMENGGVWSADSRTILFANIQAMEETMPNVFVFVADVQTQEIFRVFGDDLPEVDYSQPIWSPDPEWGTAALRTAEGSPGKQLWNIRLDGSERLKITDQPFYTHGNYTWEPGGSHLVYQRLALGSSQARPEVMVWNAESGESMLLAENASLPHWLP